jgi:hypothetical protein
VKILTPTHPRLEFTSMMYVINGFSEAIVDRRCANQEWEWMESLIRFIRYILGKVVRRILFCRNERDTTLQNSADYFTRVIPDPIESHIYSFRTLLFDAVDGNADRRCTVAHEDSRVLWISHVKQCVLVTLAGTS